MRILKALALRMMVGGASKAGMALFALVVVNAVASRVDAADPKEVGAPVGFIDEPRGDVVRGQTRVMGWALDAKGKALKMRLLLDGKPLQGLEYNQKREDVCAVHASALCPKVGFEASVDFAKVAKGSHKLSLEATGKGGTVNLAERTIRVE